MDTSQLWIAIIAGLFSLIVGLFSVIVVFLGRYWDRKGANIAVLSEIKRLLKVLAGEKKWWETCMQSGETHVPLVPFTTPVFDEQVKTIGNVDREFVASVVAFYGYVKFINAIVGERSNYVEAAKENGFNKLYADVLGNALRNHQHKFDGAFSKYGLSS